MAMWRLECPICQQDMLQTITSINEPEQDNDLTVLSSPRCPNETGRGNIRRMHTWAWSPVSTQCGHIFHKGCLLEWFHVRRHHDGCSRLRGTCPSCRKSISYENLVRLYLPLSTTGSPKTTSDHDSQMTTAANEEEVDPQNCRISNTLNQDWARRTSVFNDFLNLCGDGRESQHDLMIQFRTWILSQHDRLDIACENLECAELQNAFCILLWECKSLTRKLELEVAVSKMKTILVGSQQRDIADLKRNGRWSNTAECLGSIGLFVLIGCWLVVVAFSAFYHSHL